VECAKENMNKLTASLMNTIQSIDDEYIIESCMKTCSINVNITDQDGVSLLEKAIKSDKESVVRMLLTSDYINISVAYQLFAHYKKNNATCVYKHYCDCDTQYGNVCTCIKVKNPHRYARLICNAKHRHNWSMPSYINPQKESDNNMQPLRKKIKRTSDKSVYIPQNIVRHIISYADINNGILIDNNKK
jgi:hypothetical protein